jgi:hypothetical protein
MLCVNVCNIINKKGIIIITLFLFKSMLLKFMYVCVIELNEKQKLQIILI